MGMYLITYDVDAAHKAILTAAEGQGLLYVFFGDDNKAVRHLSRLPNTTLWGEFSTKSAAKEAFDVAIANAAIASGLTINVEKRIIAAFETYSVRSDRRKKPDKQWTGTTAFETCRLHQLNDPFFK
jgi:hypothetical protein